MRTQLAPLDLVMKEEVDALQAHLTEPGRKVAVFAIVVGEKDYTAWGSITKGEAAEIIPYALELMAEFARKHS